jgi:hypothetical protein
MEHLVHIRNIMPYMTVGDQASATGESRGAGWDDIRGIWVRRAPEGDLEVSC